MGRGEDFQKQKIQNHKHEAAKIIYEWPLEKKKKAQLLPLNKNTIFLTVDS